MISRLRATNERVQRSVAHGDCASARLGNFGTAANTAANTATGVFATDTTNATWMLKPCVPSSAICTHGKYYARRLQEIPT